MTEGRVTQIWRHPVKSMQGEQLPECLLTTAGIPGDRGWGVVDAETGKVLSAKRENRLLLAAARTVEGGVEIDLPDGRHTGSADADAGAVLSDWLGRPVELRQARADEPAGYEMHVSAVDADSPVVELPCPPGTYFDAAPVHLLTTASLRAMAGRQEGTEWDVRRFRPTLLVEVDGEGFVEDGWIGAPLGAGGAVLMVFAPTVRCAMTVHAQPGLRRDLDVAKAVNREHESNLGVYAVVQQEGPVAVGDRLSTG